MVVRMPAGAVAGFADDMWQRPLIDMGQTGPDKGQGGKYLILPPAGEDLNPPDHFVVRAKTNQVWFGSRGLAPDPVEAEATLRKHRVYGWNQRATPGETKFIPVGGRTWASWQPSDIRYFEQLKGILDPEPLCANVSETRVRVVFSVEGAGVADDQEVQECVRGSPGVGIHGAEPRRAQRDWA